MKSILFAGNYLHYSGALEVFRHLARYCKQRGIKTGYLFHRERANEIVPDMSMFDTVMVIGDAGDRETFTSQMADFANQYDIVHHSLIPMGWRFLFKRKLEVPNVETYHSLAGWERCWQSYRLRLAGAIEMPADVMIAVSQGLAKRMRADSGLDVQQIYNGVTIPEESWPYGPPRYYITYCGRLSADKGLDEWVKVAMRLHIAMPWAKFQWVGELSPNYDPAALRWLQAACPWLEVTGYQEDVSPYWAKTGCNLLTSPAEGLPMCILEAMAHGVQSVAYNNGDTRETGCITVLDAEEAVDRVKKVMVGDVPKPSDLYHRAKAYFDADQMAGEYMEVYEQCIARRLSSVIS